MATPIRAKPLTELHEQFVNEQRFSTRLSSVTLQGYTSGFQLFLAVMPEVTASLLTPGTMTEFFRRLETRTRTVGRGLERTGIKTSTVATYRSKLNRFFAWLKRKGHITDNPFDVMPYPDVHYEDRKYLGRTEVERIFSTLVLNAEWRTAFVRKRNIAIFTTLLYTGIRKGELLALRGTDVDLDRRELTIRAETSKSRIRRVVPLNSKLTIALKDYLQERRHRHLATEFFFASASGKERFTTHGLKHLTAQVRELSGVMFHVHQFRHTFAVNVLNHGGDIAKLKQLLGHRDIRMTSAYLRCLPTSAMRNDVEMVTLDRLL